MQYSAFLGINLQATRQLQQYLHTWCILPLPSRVTLHPFWSRRHMQMLCLGRSDRADLVLGRECKCGANDHVYNHQANMKCCQKRAYSVLGCFSATQSSVQRPTNMALISTSINNHSPAISCPGVYSYTPASVAFENSLASSFLACVVQAQRRTPTECDTVCY